jgi:hypothetical protein
MSIDTSHPARHVLGLAAALAAFGLILLGWFYGLPALDGTLVEEFRYLLFAGFAIGLLSGLQTLISRLFK